MTSEARRPSKNQLKRLQDLHHKKGRIEQGCFIAEGPKLIREAHQAGLHFRGLFFSETAYRSGSVLSGEDRNIKTEVFVLRDSEFKKIAPTQTPQGVLAQLEIPAPLSMPFAQTSNNLLVVLDTLSDPGNVGTAIRSSAALGADAVFLTEGCADLWNPKTVRASAGALFRVPISSGLAVKQLKERLEKEKYLLLVAASHGEDLHRLPPLSEKSAVIFGNESNGPDPLWTQSAASREVGLPMDHGVESLNVGVAVSAFLAVIREKNQNPVR